MSWLSGNAACEAAVTEKKNYNTVNGVCILKMLVVLSLCAQYIGEVYKLSAFKVMIKWTSMLTPIFV